MYHWHPAVLRNTHGHGRNISHQIQSLQNVERQRASRPVPLPHHTFIYISTVFRMNSMLLLVRCHCVLHCNLANELREIGNIFDLCGSSVTIRFIQKLFFTLLRMKRVMYGYMESTSRHSSKSIGVGGNVFTKPFAICECRDLYWI